VGLLPPPLGRPGAPGLARRSPRAGACAVLSELALREPDSHRYQFHLVLDRVVQRAQRVALGFPSAAVAGGAPAVPALVPSLPGASGALVAHCVAAFRIQRMLRDRAARRRARAAAREVF
jgi:hypothetical protein